MEIMRMRKWVVGLAVVAMLCATVAVAQPQPPYENHYKVYQTPLIPLPPTVIELKDQFNSYTIQYLTLERWANPAEKIADGVSYPPVDPIVHQMWWRGNFPTMPPIEIVGIDQFGTNKWTLINPEYLLTPALKNVPAGDPPQWNHYLCYRALPGQLERVVTIIDQFGQSTVQLIYINWFCNPVEKRLPDGRVYPIVDAKAHLACYQFFYTDPMSYPVMAIDQFGQWKFDVRQPDCLCVPALKEHVVRTEESTWGKIKALYND